MLIRSDDCSEESVKFSPLKLSEKWPSRRHSDDGDDIFLGSVFESLTGTLVMDPWLLRDFWPVTFLFSVIWGPVWVYLWGVLLGFRCNTVRSDNNNG